MRTAIAGLLWIVFTVFLFPLVRGRMMTEAPGLLWRLIYVASVAIGMIVILASDPVWPRISKPQQTQPFIGLAIIAAGAAIVIGAAWWILLGHHITAKLGFFSTVTVARQPPGTVIAGIPWRSSYAQVDLVVANTSTVDADDVSLKIMADRPIAAVGQAGELKDVDISGPEMEVKPFVLDQTTRVRTALPLERIATEMSYLIRCKSIPRKGHLRIVIASIGGMANGTVSTSYASNDYWMRVGTKPTDAKDSAKEYGTWYGYHDRPDSIYAPVVAPTNLQITGTYVSAGDNFSVDEKIPIQDFIGDAISKIPELKANKP